MRTRAPRVLTIPPGVAFLPTLADALLDGRLAGASGPAPDAALAGATIYLPTRRAARALASVLADKAGARAQLLPRIVPLGDIEEADAELPTGTSGEGRLDLPPAIPGLERRLILTRLVQGWSGKIDRERRARDPDSPFLVPATPADAVGLAGDLEALMDSFETERVAWSALGNATEAEYSRYFDMTREFVEIAAENWPRILNARAASDPAWRRSALVLAEARRLAVKPPPGPVVAAGSTGSIPATADLLAAVARLERGAVVLPGLDLDLDEAGWEAIEPLQGDLLDGRLPAPGHPQAALRRLLVALNLSRAAVQTLGQPSPTARARARLLSEALRPADTTDRWGTYAASVRSALLEEGGQGLSLIEAADEREEALAVAVAVREALERPDAKVALVTPDRGLAARVAIELQRWQVAVEDSAGLPIGDTAPGRLARLAADAAADDFRPARLLALLAHPGVRLGLPRAELERAAHALEIAALRGPAPGPGLAGLRYALNGNRTSSDRHRPRPRKRLTGADWDRAGDLVSRLERAFAGFTPQACGEGTLDLVRLGAVHREAVEALSRPPEGEEASPDPDEERAAEILEALFDDLDLAADDARVEGRFGDYPLFFAALARERTMHRDPGPGSGRVKILGLLEARLLHADRVVVGGLDEGLWPPRAETDAFLNRPMRARVGLSAPERRIGQTAHDFVQALGAEEVVISRALKRDGQPTVPSRFLQRLAAFAGEEAWSAVVGRGEHYRRLAHALDRGEPVQPLRRPAPKPGGELFPPSLSVTEIETLVRDPYAVFARHVLKLDALAAIEEAPGAALRGTLVHAVLGDFVKRFPAELPADPLAELMAIAGPTFDPVKDDAPDLWATWWPRFLTLAPAFVAWERERRALAVRVLAEQSGALPIPLPNGDTFTLRARADRIEEGRDGGFALIDFKTGQPPSNPEVAIGFSPQLTLEAAMLMRGAFREVPAAAGTPELLYVKAAGGRDPLRRCPVQPPKGDARSLQTIVEDHLAGLARLVAAFVSGEAAYLSRPYAQYARRYSDYDHLARVKEWSLAGEPGEEGEA